MGIHCWYFGCKPHDSSQNYNFIPCKRCGHEVSYGDLVGDTRHEKVKAFIKYYLYRKWIPEKCGECGKRYGKHFGCIPF